VSVGVLAASGRVSIAGSNINDSVATGNRAEFTHS